MNGCRAGIAISMLMAFGAVRSLRAVRQRLTQRSDGRGGRRERHVRHRRRSSDVPGVHRIRVADGDPGRGQRASAEDWAIVADGVDSPRCTRSSVPTPGCARTTAPELRSARRRVEAIPWISPRPPRTWSPTCMPSSARPASRSRSSSSDTPRVGWRRACTRRPIPTTLSGMVLVDALGEGLRDHMTAEQWAIQKPMLRGDIDASIAEYPAWSGSNPTRASTRCAPPED